MQEFNFSDLETYVYKRVFKLGQDYIREILEKQDQKLRNKRNKSRLINVGKRQTVIKTLLGNITFKRTLYRDIRTNQTIFLLDNNCNLYKTGQYSENVVEMVLKFVAVNSFRETSKIIEETTGLNISHQAVKNIVEDHGNSYLVAEEEKIQKSGDLKSDKEPSKVIFNEQDGVWLNLQGKDRNIFGRKKEVKLGISYEGWTKNNNRFNLFNKIAYGGMIDIEEYRYKKEGLINYHYKIDKNTIFLLNADGGTWTKDIDNVYDYYQLDIYHRNRNIVKAINNKKIRQEIVLAIDLDKDVNKALKIINEYKSTLKDKGDIKRCNDFFVYINNFKNNLLRYTDVIKLPEPPTGIYYRNMGTMEGNIWNIVCKRMKNNHSLWSVRGCNNMLSLLIQRYNNEELIEKSKDKVFEISEDSFNNFIKKKVA